MKNNFILSCAVTATALCAFQAHALFLLPDVSLLAESGGTYYKTDKDTNTNTTQALGGYHVNFSLLFPLVDDFAWSGLSFVLGPRVSYQNVNMSLNNDFGATNESLQGMFLGGEAGFKFSLLGMMHFYLTGSADYDVNGHIKISPQNMPRAFDADLKRHWEMGLNPRVIFHPLPLVGLGVGYYYGLGTYSYDGAVQATSSPATPFYTFQSQKIGYSVQNVSIVATVDL